eukprot:CAMPEP_0172938774 /NCGR_PEP_ID=MMETSP1075-20121228/223196_1 /TAXON_ID=2916 /ORGANISM="Ceratium fusus, Strain PA161109" /LENGTH=86 /DNA_ID=CAMNT_0013800157 /DNA_START=950 /DNA_END=1210 /DNA_ORIENTATION=-
MSILLLGRAATKVRARENRLRYRDGTGCAEVAHQYAVATVAHSSSVDDGNERQITSADSTGNTATIGSPGNCRNRRHLQAKKVAHE